MLMRARSGALDAARSYAKSPKEFEEILLDLKIKNI